jgi:hypothetical protein
VILFNAKSSVSLWTLAKEAVQKLVSAVILLILYLANENNAAYRNPSGAFNS